MKTITDAELRFLVGQSDMSKSFKKKISSVNQDTFWKDIDFLIIPSSTRGEGIFVYESKSGYIILRYKLSKVIPSKITGKQMSVICDLCSTWHSSGTASCITFEISLSKKYHTVTFLCCSDLSCNLNVRSLTDESLLSRAHLRENLTEEQRITRFRNMLEARIAALAAPILLPL